MNNLLTGKELYEGLDVDVAKELEAKLAQDELELATTEVETTDEVVTTLVDEVKELQVKHALNHKAEKHIKRKKQRELRNKGIEGYEDNPDKYFNKKTKKTKAIRQKEKELRHKKERQKELRLKTII